MRQDRFGQLRVKAAFGPGCHRRSRDPDPKLSDRNESAYHSGNVGERSKSRMRTVLIRHRQSTGNAGIPCHDLALLELTELGWRQCREVAERWIETPDLIVT